MQANKLGAVGKRRQRSEMEKGTLKRRALIKQRELDRREEETGGDQGGTCKDE